MDRDKGHMPVIVLMDREASGDRDTVREWFENSRFSTCEAADVFEALEEISDFTTATRPDVVLLDIESFEDEYQLIHDTIEPSRTADELPILALSSQIENVKSSASSCCFHGSLGEVAAHLDKLIPEPGAPQKHQASA
jgi:CheY-like chemotaxis protein